MKHKTELLLNWLCIGLAVPGLFAQAGQTLTGVNPGLAPAGSPDLPVALYTFLPTVGTPSFTPLWNGSARPTKIVNGQPAMLLSAADLATPGLNEITVFDNKTGAMWPGGWKFPVYIPQSANDLVYDAQRKLLYASVPSTGGPKGNSVVAINPDTGDVTASVFVGSEPDRMAMTDDSQWLYVFNDGANSIVRLALDSFRPDPTFTTAGTAATGLNTTPIVSAVPGSPNAVLVGQNSTFRIFDSGVARGKTAAGNGVVAWTGANTFVNTLPQLFQVNSAGVVASGPSNGSNGGYVQDVKWAAGRVYLSNGQVFDSSNLALLGKFSGSGLVEVDPANQRVYLLGGSPGSFSYSISAFDVNTFVPEGAIGLTGFDNTYGNAISRVLRFGQNGVAFPYRAQTNISSGGSDKLFVLHSSLFDAAPVISAASIVNAASNQAGAVAPGEIVAIYGTGLGPAVPRSLQLSASGTVDTAAGDTKVFFNGIPAPVLFTSQGQVNVVVPYAVSRVSSVSVQVSCLGVLSNSITIPVQASVPALFTANGSGSGQAAAGNQDFSINSTANPAARGSIITLYATGGGQTNPVGSDGKVGVAPLPAPVQNVRVTIGGVDASVQYAGGAQGLVAGVMQVNVVVPPQITPAAAVPIVLSVGGATSPGGVTIGVR
jgi:uncharacterized protein (TIGR03437 family)